MLARLSTTTVALAALAAAAAPVGAADAAPPEERLTIERTVHRTAGQQEPSRAFPEGFEAHLPDDAYLAGKEGHLAGERAREWSSPKLGGWGSDDCAGGRQGRRPIIFVHGASGDAGFWAGERFQPDDHDHEHENEGWHPHYVDVRQSFLESGWCPRQLWAVSYHGRAAYGREDDGPDAMTNYVNWSIAMESEELFAFIAAVRDYLHVPRVDVVAHSLGATAVRKAGLDHPELYSWIDKFVSIAAPEHGLLPCAGGAAGAAQYEICQELEPGGRWLENLNDGNGEGETPDGPRFMTLYNPERDAAQFWMYLHDPHTSALEGACNVHRPGFGHEALALDERAVATYQQFLDNGRCPGGETARRGGKPS